jgi:ribosomal protein S18 acetylase RimI-like enzyme
MSPLGTRSLQRPQVAENGSLILNGWSTTVNWTVERANTEDAAEILALQKLAYQSEAAIYGDYTIAPLTQTLEEMKADVRELVVLKATVEGRIVGSVRGRVVDGTCYVGRLIVHPDVQNRGLGTALLHAIERGCPVARRFELFTGHRSARNLHLYHELGYASFKEERISERLTLVFLDKHVPPNALTGATIAKSKRLPVCTSER